MIRWIRTISSEGLKECADADTWDAIRLHQKVYNLEHQARAYRMALRIMRKRFGDKK